MNTSHTSKTPYKQLTKISAPDFSILAKILTYTGVCFYLFSLPLVSLFTSSEDIHGIWILLIGWLGIVILQLSWFANPLNLLALLLVTRRPLLALLLSFIAFLFASQAFEFSEIPAGLNHEKVFIKEMGLGFYLWYVSHGLFFIAIFIRNFGAVTKKRGLASFQ